MRRKSRRLFALLQATTIVLSLFTYGFSHASAAEASSGTSALPPGESLPRLLITEVLPDSTNVGGGDGYEFIEVYNNSDQPINFKDYKLIYRYPASEDSDVAWDLAKPDIVIEPGRAVVFWTVSDQDILQNITVAHFNSLFKTNLVENKDIVRMIGPAMHNTRQRSVVIGTNTGYDVAVAEYNTGTDDVAKDKGIMYNAPAAGSNKMILSSSAALPASPGKVESGQLPSEPVHITPDTLAPTITNLSGPNIRESESASIAADSQDDVWTRTFTLFYKTDRQSAYTKANLARSGQDSLYRHSIDFLELLGSREIDYYFVASDGINETTSGNYRIDIMPDPVSPRLNIKDGDPISGEAVVKASANGADPNQLSLSIDGINVNTTYRALEKTAYLLFEANGMDGGFKNAVTLNQDVLRLLDEGVADFNTVVVPVQPDQLENNGNVITVRAGSKKSTFEQNPDENLDDFSIRNARLILVDGTVLRDPRYSDPAMVLNMGDDGAPLPVVDFAFQIPEEKKTALAYRWNTAAATDGEHLVKVVAPDQTFASAKVRVDNQGPSIEPTVEEGRSYKGPFTIDAVITDQVGLQNVSVQLDGRFIQLPYVTSSAILSPGSHTLLIRATDTNGHLSERIVRFSSVVENPDPPALVGPQNGSVNADLNPKLSVVVHDPTQDDLNISFYKGYRYTAADTVNIQVYRNESDVEPPQTYAPSGETAIIGDELVKLGSSDDQYLTVDSTTKFPYLRFQIQLEGQIHAQDLVEIDWEGKSLKGRKVTMYAWSVGQSRWVPLDSRVAESENDFTLKGTVSAGDFVQNHVVNVMVQDQIPARSDYDYTFVWMSDTQFYAEVFPQIFESEVNWIKDHASDMNIQYVIHTGDIVNQVNQDYQWQTADQSMGVLDNAGIPYGVLAGNHDVVSNGDTDYTNYYKVFGDDRFQGKPYFGESYKNNRGHYDLISANGNDYIIVYMGWEIGDEEIAWLNKVLAEHPDRKAILGFHEYMRAGGTRSATGDMLFNEVVVKNPNVFMVLSGHFTGSSLLTSDLDDNGDGQPDRKVYQILTDYQDFTDGGSGYMKLMHFDTETGQIYFNTYSPYKNDYNYYEPAEYPGKDEFTLASDLAPQLKRVATDAIGVKHYSLEQIGETVHAASGKTVETLWNGLTENSLYSWYVRAEDSFGGRAVSDIWSFKTRNAVPAPMDLRAVTVTDTSAEIAWDPVVDPDAASIGYDVYVNGQKTASVTNAVYGAAGLAPDTEYTFLVKAKDEIGNESLPSPTLTIRTKVNLSVVQSLVNDYVASGQLKSPLIPQLVNSLEQAGHQWDLGNKEQAIKHVEDFLKHLGNQALQDYVTPEASQVLGSKAAALIEFWK